MLLTPLYNKPNRILERQKAIQNDPRKIMFRLPRSKLYIGVYGAMFTVGMLGTTYGIVSLLRGKPSE
ncbi:hypothetical protein D9615_000712 [Tricholomella constricta]|uniref:Uncharacterized protein n=1 Tax=Tricholomella constricta TaxID=117010 RepID=A0A8H5HQK0_9AGAR|nr:hypothetical protein D9615_000712 [Tricholomella constricta]